GIFCIHTKSSHRNIKEEESLNSAREERSLLPKKAEDLLHGSVEFYERNVDGLNTDSLLAIGFLKGYLTSGRLEQHGNLLETLDKILKHIFRINSDKTDLDRRLVLLASQPVFSEKKSKKVFRFTTDSEFHLYVENPNKDQDLCFR
ncbi:uncharacterized protein LOC111712769, partial [Eurytemora carolleeae]|uniref:uncharacterized protein LOC111712769 n=1 Tax=Eurytemora carolleeae TaxID=1294199 RepID=UPI000C760E8A